MPDTLTQAAQDRLLTTPPDIERLQRDYPWIFGYPDDRYEPERTRYLLLYTDRNAPGVPEIYTYAPAVRQLSTDIRQRSHGGHPWGVWDCEQEQYVTTSDDVTSRRCTCPRCLIRDGGTFEAVCTFCSADVTISAENVHLERYGAPFCSQDCLDEHAEEEAREEARQNGYMRNYSWKPRPNFLRVNGEPDTEELFFGFELELPSENRTYLSSAVYDGPGEAERVLYCKDDSSIYGAEVVSHPMTHRYFRESLDFHGLFSGEVARHVDGEPDTGYGLHVHVSRKGFKSQAHALRWLLLIYRNSDEMARLSRRSAGQWSTFRDIGACEEKATRIGAGDRYTAVNAQNNDTFEVRCFRSTYTEQEFRAAVDFCHASVVYTRSLNNNGALKGDALTWAKFRAWVDERPEYEHLTKELTRVAVAPMPPADDDLDDSDNDDDWLDGDGVDDSGDAPCTCAGCRIASRAGYTV